MTMLAPMSVSGVKRANVESNRARLPGGIRTFIESRGGVMPRRMCGLSSSSTAIVVPLASASTARGTRGPTRTESYWNGGLLSMESP